MPPQQSEDTDYERLTQAVYQAILAKEGYQNIKVEHNVNLTGRSDTAHQIDVYWHFKQAGVEYKVLVECKNYSRKISLGKIRDFHSVIEDLGPCKGIMVTTTGYQAGVKTFASHYGIGLKLLQSPTPKDLEKGMEIVFHLHLRVLSMKHRIKIRPIPSNKPLDEALARRLTALREAGDFGIPDMKDLILFDGAGNPKTGRFAEWVQDNLFRGRDIGGPYTQRIDLVGYHFPINQGKPNQELVPIDGIEVDFWIDGADHTIAFHANQVVEAILRDEFSGEVEHIHQRSA